MIINVQAHSLREGIIDTEGLVQGGQLAFLSFESDNDNAVREAVPEVNRGVEDFIAADVAAAVVDRGLNDDLVDKVFSCKS